MGKKGSPVFSFKLWVISFIVAKISQAGGIFSFVVTFELNFSSLNGARMDRTLCVLCLHSLKELQNIPGLRAKNPLEDGLHGDVTAAILATPYFAKHLHFLYTVPSLQSRGPQYFWHQEPVSWKAIFSMEW